MVLILLEKRGRTLNLLKESSKTLKEIQKRRKIAIAATPQEFKNRSNVVMTEESPENFDKTGFKDITEDMKAKLKIKSQQQAQK